MENNFLKQQERDRLYRLLSEKEKEVEKARTKRLITTMTAFTVAYYIILYWMDEPSGFDLIANIFVALIFAGIHLAVNGVIFSQIFDAVRAENKMLDDIRKQISQQN